MPSAFFPSQQNAGSPLPASPADNVQEEPAHMPNGARQGETPTAPGIKPQSIIRVLVVDDHELIRRGLSAVLGEQEDFQVVGQAANGSAAVMLAKQVQPHI